MRHPDLLEREGRKAEVSVLFCDIRRFTTFAESRSPDEVLERLNAVLEAFSLRVQGQGGSLYALTELGSGIRPAIEELGRLIQRLYTDPHGSHAVVTALGVFQMSEQGGSIEAR